MTLSEAKTVLDSLKELSPNIEDFSWGPTYNFARHRQQNAIMILKKEITRLTELEKQK